MLNNQTAKISIHPQLVAGGFCLNVGFLKKSKDIAIFSCIDILLKLWYNLYRFEKEVIFMAKKYSVKETTRVEREKIANDALAISILDAPEPTENTKKLVDEYINGNMEIGEVLQKTIAQYKVSI